METLREIFGGHLFVELAHTLRPHDSSLLRKMHELATALHIPTVATGDVRYATEQEYRRYDLLSCIRLGWNVFNPHPDRPVNAEQHLKSEQALRRLIPFPEAFENTERIASGCDVDLLPGHVTPPEAIIPDGRSAHDWLAELSVDALLERYPAERQEQALLQLRKELEIIDGLGLDEYFLVVREVVAEARRRGIRCAGRGSAANSLVAYLLDITGVCPIEHNLLFERFLHGGRKGTPDIDVDFDSERRDEVIDWMERRFGIEHTAMTATVTTYGLRMALRDVAKALGWPAEIVDAMTQSVPHRRAGTVREYREELAAVSGDSPLFELLLTMVEGLEGCPRHLGLHSGGMLLTRSPLYHYTPVQISANGVKVVQFDKEDVEKMGLIKFDVLGLRMLAALSEAEEIARRASPDLPPKLLPDRLDDQDVYQMIRDGKTLGLFQIESQGQMHLLAQHQPQKFNDLIVEIALFRPGPLQGGMVHPYVRRRRGLEPVVYEHPDLEPMLRDTCGVILFQEQVLEICHHFAGMSLEQADIFRSLMSKFRDPGEMEGMRSRFVDGATGRGVEQEIAESVFNRVANFVGYGFCRSHAAAFARTVYDSAWMKCHYPAEFMAALMQHRPGMYSLMTLEEEARRLGIRTLPPDIACSGIRYDLEEMEKGEKCIRKPLLSITGLTIEGARAIVMARLERPFESVEDLYRRVPLERDTLDSIARSGALDALSGSSRRALWEIGLLARRLGVAGAGKREMLFDLDAVADDDIPTLPALTAAERLRWDYQTHGAARYHPMILLRRTLIDLEIRPIITCFRFTASKLRPRSSPNPVVTVAGLAVLRQMPPTAKGVMFITLEDESGFIQCIVLPEVQAALPPVLRSPALIVRGSLRIVGQWRGLMVTDAWALEGTIGGYGGYPSAYGGTDRLFMESKAEEHGIDSYREKTMKIEDVGRADVVKRARVRR